MDRCGHRYGIGRISVNADSVRLDLHCSAIGSENAAVFYDLQRLVGCFFRSVEHSILGTLVNAACRRFHNGDRQKLRQLR